MKKLQQITKGSSLSARVMRSSALTVFGFGTSQVIRLATNLILTRLLFPEAFGMMALISVVLMGLGQFSDVGLGPSIMQSKRGDDQDFLNTAWTIQIIRGTGLWITATALAYPIALFYDELMLAQLMPIAALTLLIDGFKTTRLESAQRRLKLGRLTILDIAIQLVGVVATVALAWWLESVWAMVISGVISSIVQLFLYDTFLPGKRNRLRWEKSSAHELIHFGKWIFLSTVCGFLFAQSDKMIIGKFLSLGHFGVYNIGFFLASFPMILAGLLTRRILIPIYREKPPKESHANFVALRKMRFALTAALITLVFIFAALGVWLVEFLYDPRYHEAGAIVTVLAIMQIPHIIVVTYDQAALAAGDSRRFFVLTVAKAAFMISGLIIGLETAGLFGALIGQGLAMLAIYPVAVWLARSMGAWDPLHDLSFAALGILVGVLAFRINWPEIVILAQKFSP
ncbi:MAG: polysaccharide biosynthesis protein [Gammaproteobacteria bacterium]|nr:MAG: polysaccharide biosynthesis protein [Gammaproteobacteria bacterium]